MSHKNLIDLTGKRFGRLLVIQRGKNKGSQPTWICLCDCGSHSNPQGTTLRSGSSKSCGCLAKELTRERLTADLTGRRFGRLVAISVSHRKPGQSWWNCLCDCGNAHVATCKNLSAGNVSSCGCYRNEIVSRQLARLTAEKSRIAREARKSLGIEKMNQEQRRAFMFDANHAAAGRGREYPKRSLVFERDGNLCHICHLPVDPEDWHMDHILPVARGGLDTYDNVAVAHPFCNMSKGTN